MIAIEMLTPVWPVSGSMSKTKQMASAVKTPERARRAAFRTNRAVRALSSDQAAPCAFNSASRAA
ncbi:hypothetical protein ACX0FG_15370, partial [Enterococcus faecium]